MTQTTPDRLPKHDRRTAERPHKEPTAPRPVEPHWESVIAAATD